MKERKFTALDLALAVLAGYLLTRAIQLLPREGELRREQEALGRVQGIDWDWKYPEDWRERFFGLQEVQEL